LEAINLKQKKILLDLTLMMSLIAKIKRKMILEADTRKE
jgi:hypothetical protein